MYFLLFVVVQVIALVAAQGNGPYKVSKSSTEREFHLKKVHILLDVGWYQFAFGNAATFAFQSFHFRSDDFTAVTVTDAYCEGDAFLIYDQSIPLVPTYWNCPYIITPICQFNVPNPTLAVFDGEHCLGGSNLNPGHHNITIEVLNSPYTGGAGFVRVDTVCIYRGLLIFCCFLEDSCNFNVYLTT